MPPIPIPVSSRLVSFLFLRPLFFVVHSQSVLSASTLYNAVRFSHVFPLRPSSLAPLSLYPYSARLLLLPLFLFLAPSPLSSPKIIPQSVRVRASSRPPLPHLSLSSSRPEAQAYGTARAHVRTAPHAKGFAFQAPSIHNTYLSTLSLLPCARARTRPLLSPPLFSSNLISLHPYVYVVGRSRVVCRPFVRVWLPLFPIRRSPLSSCLLPPASSPSPLAPRLLPSLSIARAPPSVVHSPAPLRCSERSLSVGLSSFCIPIAVPARLLARLQSPAPLTLFLFPYILA